MYDSIMSLTQKKRDALTRRLNTELEFSGSIRRQIGQYGDFLAFQCSCGELTELTDEQGNVSYIRSCCTY